MPFNTWLSTFISEKAIDLDEVFSVAGPSGENFMPYQCVVDAIRSAPRGEQAAIKSALVLIDFRNADVRHYFRHLAQAIAI